MINYINFSIENLNVKHAQISNILASFIARAYNIIFSTNTTYVENLTKKEIDKINKLIFNSFKLSQYANITKLKNLNDYIKYFESYPQTYSTILLVGNLKYLENKSKTKNKPLFEIEYEKEKQKYGEEIGLWHTPDILKTKERKYYIKEFSGTYEEIFASGVFFLVNKIIKAFEEKNIVLYGNLISSTFSLIESAEYNKKSKEKGRTKNNKIKNFEDFIKNNKESFLKTHRYYKQRIDFIIDTFKVSNNTAKKYYSLYIK